MSIIDRNMASLKQNSDCVTEEIDNITKRLIKSIRDRGDFLRNEVSVLLSCNKGDFPKKVWSPSIHAQHIHSSDKFSV